MNHREQAKARAKAAMPQVKKLVQNFGRTAINNCLIKLRDLEKSTNRLKALEKEVASLRDKVK